MAAERHIVGLGGGGDTEDQTRRLYEYVLGLTGKQNPNLLYAPTPDRCCLAGIKADLDDVSFR